MYGSFSYGSATYGGTAGGRRLTLTLTDSISADDTVTYTRVTVSIFTDSVNAADPNITRSVSKILTSSIAVSSVLSKIISLHKTLTDSLAVATSSFTKGVSKTFTSPLQVASTIRRGITKVLSDNTIVVDTISRIFTKSLTLVDSIITSSIISGISTVSKTLTLIYNILEFVLGIRVNPTILSIKKDTPALLTGQKEAPFILSQKDFIAVRSVTKDSPMVVAEKDAPIIITAKRV